MDSIVGHAMLATIAPTVATHIRTAILRHHALRDLIRSVQACVQINAYLDIVTKEQARAETLMFESTMQELSDAMDREGTRLTVESAMAYIKSTASRAEPKPPAKVLEPITALSTAEHLRRTEGGRPARYERPAKPVLAELIRLVHKELEGHGRTNVARRVGLRLNVPTQIVEAWCHDYSLSTRRKVVTS